MLGIRHMGNILGFRKIRKMVQLLIRIKLECFILVICELKIF